VQVAKPVDVHRRLAHLQQVAAGLAADAETVDVRQRGTQPRQVAAQCHGDPVRLVLSPDAVGELVERDGPVRVGQ
jgi:hypothetical protein